MLQKKIIAFLIIAVSGLQVVCAQPGLTSDELFQKAREAAFDKKDYHEAINLSLKALEISPAYSDIRIFLGRIYTWSDNYDKAKEAFNYVIAQNPDSEDATIALTDLEYWNDYNEKALKACNSGLKYNLASQELLLRKAKILNAMRRFDEAYRVASELVEQFPKNSKARALLQSIRFDSAMNKVSISHDFTWFDGHYPNHLHNYPWHIVGVDYNRYTGMGSVIGRLNYGNRFGNEAFQFEMDSYPSLFRNVYAYVNASFSDKSAVFPRFRTGVSLYASLPHSFEAEAGFRMLHFSGNTWIYVGSVAKYYKNFWFNSRVYLVPGESNISQSYSFVTRYYYGGADDYLKVNIGYGLSPDEQNAVQEFTSGYKLKSAHLTIGVKKSIRKFNVIGATVSGVAQEFEKDVTGNQLSTSITYIRKF